MFLAVTVFASTQDFLLDAALLIVACIGTLSFLGSYFALAQSDRRDKRLLEEFPELRESLDKELQQRNMQKDGHRSISESRLAMANIKQMQVASGVLFLFSTIWILIGFIVAP